MTTFGEISYSDDVYTGDKKQNNKDLFLRLVEGTNEVRLVTAPYQYMVHKYKKDPNDKKDFGQKVSCSLMHGRCPLCDLDDKPKARWFYGVIDRKTGTYKVLDVSWQVFSDIKKLARNTARWGDPTKYDIDIVVDKNAGPGGGYYSVQPISKEPLSASDQKLKDDADLDDLKRRCTPLTPEEVQKRMDKIRPSNADNAPVVATTTSTPTAKASKTTKAAAKTATVSMTDDDELDSSFPAFNSEETEAS